SPSYRGGRERVEIGRPASEGLRRLSQREGATLFMALMAAFKVVLMRHSGEADVSVGTVIANRTRREVEGLIGFFVNTLVMRTDLAGNPSFRELIKRERAVALGAYGHQEVPFEKLVEEINPDRALSRSPLFQVMMTLQNTRQEELEIKGLKVSVLREETGVTKFDLTLMLTEVGERIVGWLEYSQDLYEAESIRGMARHYEKVVEEVVRDAEQRIKEIGLMSQREKRQIIEEWNETQRGFGEAQLVHEMVAEQARQRAEAIALKSEQGELSYRELDVRSNKLGNYLRRRGVGREDVVGICADRSAEMVIAMLGVLKAGAAYMPIDGSYPEERVRYMLEDACAKVLLTQGEAARWLKKENLRAQVVDLVSRWEEIVEEKEDSPAAQVEGNNLAYIIYTSGSTGQPKGVAVSHHSLINLLCWHNREFSVSTGDRATQLAGVGFDASIWEMWPYLTVGAGLHIAEETKRRDIPELIRWMVTE